MRDHKNGRQAVLCIFDTEQKALCKSELRREGLTSAFLGGDESSVGGWWWYLILYQSFTSIQIQKDREAMKLHPCSDSGTIKECLFVNYK